MLVADRCLAVVGLGMGRSRSPYLTMLIAAALYYNYPFSYGYSHFTPLRAKLKGRIII